MTHYIVDTTVLVDHLRKTGIATNFLEEHAPTFSAVSKAELIEGAKDKNGLQSVIKICSVLPESKISEKIADQAIDLMEKYRLSHGLLFLDALIAATAITQNLTLVTGNIKHFSFIPNLDLKNWGKIEKEYNQARTSK